MVKMTLKNTFKKIKENHWLMMAICCLIPIIIAGILFYFGFKTYAIIAVMLLCPILHYFMMKDMHGKHEKESEGGDKTEKENKKCH